MSDMIIIGGGPAGVSAALYAARAGIQTTIIRNGNGALGKAERIENYYGFAAPVTGPALASAGIAQAARLGVTIVEGEAVGVALDTRFTVTITSAENADITYEADAVILATGASRAEPAIEGFGAYEGRGVSYCAVCDAFFFRGKNVAVLGSGAYALHEAMALEPVVGSVAILTNGAPPTADFPDTMRVVNAPVRGLTGEPSLDGVLLENGTHVPFAGLFVALGVAGSADLAKKIGADLNGADIAVDATMMTSVPGLFAAGDCTGGMRQIAKAVYEGMVAGTEAVRFLRRATT